MKKWIMVVMSLSLLTGYVFGQSADEFGIRQNRQGFITIVDYLGFAAHVVFPATIEGIRVTEIDFLPAVLGRRGILYMYDDTQRITSVIIPNSVTRIGEKVFHMDPLTKITIGSGVNIAQNAFRNNFVDFYSSQGRKAGTYIWTGRLWKRE
jgi:hypothetical protein